MIEFLLGSRSCSLPPRLNPKPFLFQLMAMVCFQSLYETLLHHRSRVLNLYRPFQSHFIPHVYISVGLLFLSVLFILLPFFSSPAEKIPKKSIEK